MNNEELLCEKEYKPFKVFIYTQPEDIDIAEMFDEEEEGFDSRYISKNDRATLRSPAYCGD